MEQAEPSEGDDAAALTTLWRDRGILPFVDGDGSQSLAASDRALVSGLTRSSGGARLDEATRASLAREGLDLGEALGQGGMGVVHVAVQRSLRREVAVKQLGEHADEAALASLLKEAWIGGLLTHPNVAPVHTLVDLDGAPAVVMKRISGTSWRDAIRDPRHVPEADRGDALGFHLRVFVAVCNAVHHAHQRGVLHLDLKPENVMLGRFGETCVIDWGLAAGWGENAPSWMPRASEIRSVSGTPDYMAPEIAGVDAPNISPRTDVYLLGATLHEVVTGRAPHRGGPAVDRMARAFRSEPIQYPASVPDELARILRRAMHRDPNERHPSAEALRDDVESFVARRRADERVREARARVATLEDTVERVASEVEIQRAFGAARFALREAETARPDMDDAGALKERMHVAMARAALDAGKLALAEHYLSTLSTSATDVKQRLKDLREREAARTQRVRTLEHLAHEVDLDEGSRVRRNVLLGFSLVLLVGNLAYWGLDRVGLLPHHFVTLFLEGLVLWVPVCAYLYAQRAKLFRNKANTTMYAIAIAAFAAVQLMWLVDAALDLPFVAGVLISGIAYVLAAGAVTSLVSPRFAPSLLFAGVGLLVAPFVPDAAWIVFAVCSALSLGSVAVAWPSHEEPTP